MHDTLRPSHGHCGRSGRAMTRCECADVGFDEVARLVAGGRSLDEAQVATGAGLMCTACMPELREHVCRALAAASAAHRPHEAPPTDQQPRTDEPVGPAA